MATTPENQAAKVAAEVQENVTKDDGLAVERDVKAGYGVTGGRKIENVRNDKGEITGVKVTYYNRNDLGGPAAEHVTVNGKDETTK